MDALVGEEAKSNLVFSVGMFGMLAQDAAGQDRGDFGGALPGGEMLWRG